MERPIFQYVVLPSSEALVTWQTEHPDHTINSISLLHMGHDIALKVETTEGSWSADSVNNYGVFVLYSTPTIPAQP